MIGHGQYGDIQYGSQSKTWLSSGTKTQSSLSTNTSGLFSTGDDTVTPTGYNLSSIAATDLGGAIEVAKTVDELYGYTTATDTGNATDASTSTPFVLSPAEAIDVPLEVYALSQGYQYDVTETSELGTSILKAIGSEQYGNWQWGAISVGLPSDRVISTKYEFVPQETLDIGDSAIRSLSVEQILEPSKVVDTGYATERETEATPWEYSPYVGEELIVDVASGQKIDYYIQSALSKVTAYTTELGDPTPLVYTVESTSDVGEGLDWSSPVGWNYLPTVQGEIGNTTLDGSPISYALSITTSDALSVGLVSGGVVQMLLSPVAGSVVSTGIDDVSSTGYYKSPAEANELVKVILTGTSEEMNYEVVQTGDTGAIVDFVTSTNLILSPVATSDIGEATDIGISTNLALNPITTEDEGWILDITDPTNYEVVSLSGDVIGTATESSESVEMVYKPILVTEKGVIINTILITHDYNSEFILNN